MHLWRPSRKKKSLPFFNRNANTWYTQTKHRQNTYNLLIALTDRTRQTESLKMKIGMHIYILYLISATQIIGILFFILKLVSTLPCLIIILCSTVEVPGGGDFYNKINIVIKQGDEGGLRLDNARM